MRCVCPKAVKKMLRARSFLLEDVGSKRDKRRSMAGTSD